MQQQLVPNLWFDNDPDPDRSRRAMEAMFGTKKLDIAALRAAADGAPVAS
jgi:hypothetical protein